MLEPHGHTHERELIRRRPVSMSSTSRRRRAQSHGVTAVLIAIALGACTSPASSDHGTAGPHWSHVIPATGSSSGDATHGATSTDTLATERDDASSYEGVDSRGIPRYATLALSSDDSLLLRRAYGVEDPGRLYVSDSTEEGILKYDTRRKRCLTCYVNSYRIGYVSVRRPGETWEEVERRVRSTAPQAFTGSAHPMSTSTADLDPDVRPLAEGMLRAARAAGFRLRVTATYRSPLREAFLMAEGKGRTHTLTSNHSYGRALDIVVDDGNRAEPRTKRDWIAFRHWVMHYRTPTSESFRVLGRIDRTWDWPHVELPSSTIGFDNIAQAIARARACLAPGASTPCNFPPHLRANLSHALVR